ncbi:MAG TPA: hypothetical protein PLT45_09790, partial [Smithella sp.]|nr:hypothetical protein [Smithella sp.]
TSDRFLYCRQRKASSYQLSISYTADNEKQVLINSINLSISYTADNEKQVLINQYQYQFNSIINQYQFNSIINQLSIQSIIIIQFNQYPTSCDQNILYSQDGILLPPKTKSKFSSINNKIINNLKYSMPYDHT